MRVGFLTSLKMLNWLKCYANIGDGFWLFCGSIWGKMAKNQTFSVLAWLLSAKNRCYMRSISICTPAHAMLHFEQTSIEPSDQC
ncbi:hypothetical protein A9306_06805 [Moraxella atlantae]|uniref:Uncharacterized protein n=1 Tax=Faucicola atlantae TaxID=34059 RepID=A0A1B8QGG3_9GAMM|nr:hypothetical protein A9306_06805 [Moraxella atlantae]